MKLHVFIVLVLIKNVLKSSKVRGHCSLIKVTDFEFQPVYLGVSRSVNSLQEQQVTNSLCERASSHRTNGPIKNPFLSNPQHSLFLGGIKKSIHSKTKPFSLKLVYNLNFSLIHITCTLFHHPTIIPILLFKKYSCIHSIFSFLETLINFFSHKL